LNGFPVESGNKSLGHFLDIILENCSFKAFTLKVVHLLSLLLLEIILRGWSILLDGHDADASVLLSHACLGLTQVQLLHFLYLLLLQLLLVVVISQGVGHRFLIFALVLPALLLGFLFLLYSCLLLDKLAGVRQLGLEEVRLEQP